MNTYIQEIELMLSQGEIERVLPLLQKLANTNLHLKRVWVLLSGRYHKNEQDFALGILERAKYDEEVNKIRASIGQMISQNFESWKEKPIPDLLPEGKIPKKDVFISYSHRNTEVALKVKSRLEKEDIDIQIDMYEMYPGINVYEYIKKAVSNSTYTLSIISEDSLASTWVAMETLGTFKDECVHGRDRFIPCYLDKSFMDVEFTLKAIKRIDHQLGVLNQVIAEQNKHNVDTRNLNEEKSRLHELRSNIDEIIGRLKRTKCMNIGAPFFEENMCRIIERIKQNHAG